MLVGGAFARRGNVSLSLQHRAAFLLFPEDLAIKTGSQRLFRGEIIHPICLAQAFEDS